MAIVLLLIGTNLRANRAGRAARFKKHVVEYSESNGRAENRLVPSAAAAASTASAQAQAAAFEYDEDVAEV